MKRLLCLLTLIRLVFHIKGREFPQFRKDKDTSTIKCTTEQGKIDLREITQ